MNIPEFPLLKRELTEAAQRGRTYVLRSVCLSVFTLIFLAVYMMMTSNAVQAYQLLGSGRHMLETLFFTLLLAVILLTPAMSCSVISLEKEKQTLGLLLVSRLTPWDIIFEKLMSRMMPVLTLLIVASPLFAISYLFGGMSVGDIVLGVLVLLLAILQITAVSLLCSAVMNSALASYWATYVVLAKLYFAWPILVAIGVLDRPETPRWFAVVSDIQRYLGVSVDPDIQPVLTAPEEIMFPGYQIQSVLKGHSMLEEYLLIFMPPLMVTCVLLVASRFALTTFANQTIAAGPVFQKAKARVIDVVVHFFGRIWPARRLQTALPTENDTRSDFVVSDEDAIAWRERKSSIVTKPRIIAMICFVLLTVPWLILESDHPPTADDFCATVSFGVVIIGVLLVSGVSCKVFAKERERKTLESLLTLPLSNKELLAGKIKGINRLISMWLFPVLITGALNVFYSRVRLLSFMSDNFEASYVFFYSDESITKPISQQWFIASLVYFVTIAGNTFIYLQLVKWISIYIGLRASTLMKAMVGSLVTLLVICFVPLLSLLVLSLLATQRPDSFVAFFFSSPLVTAAFNEYHDFTPFLQRDNFPNTELQLIAGNFLVYGIIAFVCRSLVYRRIATLLGRRDEPSSSRK